MTAATDVTDSLAARQILSLPDDLQSLVDATLADVPASEREKLR